MWLMNQMIDLVCLQLLPIDYNAYIIVISNKEITRFPILDALQAQVNEIRDLVKMIAKGKQKETDPDDHFIDWRPEASRKTKYGQAGSSKSAAGTASSSKATGKTGSSKSAAGTASRSRSRASPKPRRSRSDRSSSASSSSSSSSSSSTSTKLYYEEIDKDLRMALRVFLFPFTFTLLLLFTLFFYLFYLQPICSLK
jgi:hypothetical protein